jgi:hypothetical protein
VSERRNAGGAGGLGSFAARGRGALAGLVLLAGVSAIAQPYDSGKFEVLEAGHELIDGRYHINGLIYLRLPSDATQALHATLPLTIRIEVQFLNRLWFWWDNTEFERIARFRLSYYPLTDRYVVENEQAEEPASGSAGHRQTFPTLPAALEYIGRVEELAVVEAAELDRNLRYDLRIRAVLDQDELPGPLRLFAFWRNDWSIGSEWLVWQLDAE